MALHQFGSQTPASSLYWPSDSLASSALSPEEAKSKTMSTAPTNDAVVPAMVVLPPSTHQQPIQSTPQTVAPSRLRPTTMPTAILTIPTTILTIPTAIPTIPTATPTVTLSSPRFAAKSLHPPREPGYPRMLHPRYKPGINRVEEPLDPVTNKNSEDDDHEPRCSPTLNREEPPAPVTNKRKRDSEDDDHEPRSAPAHSLVANNIYRHESCPIKRVHNTGIYRHKGQDVPAGDEQARAKGKLLFGDSNPPPWMWWYVRVIEETSNRVLNLVGTIAREGALMYVSGFAKAHFKAGMTEEEVGSLLSGGL